MEKTIRTRNITNGKIKAWYATRTDEDKKELLEAYTAWCKSREVKNEETSELFDELVKLTGFDTTPDYEGSLNTAIKNLENQWHGWYCTYVQVADGVTYAKYEDGSYVQYDKEGKVVVVIKGDEDLPTRAFVKDDGKGNYVWTENHEYVTDQKWLDYLNDLVHTVKMTVAVYPHGMYDDMDWVADYIYNDILKKYTDFNEEDED